MNKVNPTIRERKYCSCIIQVSGKSNKNDNNSPYALCTHSLYNKKGLKRNKVVPCDNIIDFNKYNLNELKGYAKMKNINVTNNGKYKSKTELVNDLNKLSNN